MCGILGIVAPPGRDVRVSDAALVHMRDLMTHRGPDDAGLWRAPGVSLAHRRLSVVDTSAAGRQPMTTPDGASALVYNGELYNDAELRRELTTLGVRFRSTCDSETVLHALAAWGEGALPRFRGMYALGFWDARRRRLLLARDPLGVKPLYFARWAGELVFASEIPPILAHPDAAIAPNLGMVSAYLSTIRTVLVNDTLFEGVHALAPGELLRCDASGEALAIEIAEHWRPPPVGAEISEPDAAEATRRVVEESVSAHLRADVPTCALLSGGLDSAITATLAARGLDNLRTYCAGADEGDDDADLAWARRAADHIGTRHAEATLDEPAFAARWAQMIGAMGIPLSTPNEVAIYTVAQRLRRDACVVTISGEGADELFAGYEPPMRAAWLYAMESIGAAGGGRFQLESNAWIPTPIKETLFTPRVWEGLDGDAPLAAAYEAEFARCAREAGGVALPIDAHLRFLRRVNLTGLLQRLDTATMLAGVEGRTPFADARVAELAESLPMCVKFALQTNQHEGPAAAGVAVATAARTKIALREAFRAQLPPGVADRPKASFTLPFTRWLGAGAPALHRSALLQEMFRPEAVEIVAADPAAHWRLAWPMINLALWGERWWG